MSIVGLTLMQPGTHINNLDHPAQSLKKPLFWLKAVTLSFLQSLAAGVVCGAIAVLSEMYGGAPLPISHALVFGIGMPIFVLLIFAVAAFEAKLRTPILRRYVKIYFYLCVVLLMV